MILELLGKFTRLRQENEKLKAEIGHLRQELARDELTGLFNARHLRERLEDAIEDLASGGHSPALLFLDVDRFKEINEMHGHAAAGNILRQLGRLIGNLIRVEDMGFRYGGDEFVVIIGGGEAAARRVGERLRSEIEAHEFTVRGLRGTGKVSLTVSIGFRVFRDGDTAQKLLEDADRAMFEAKRRSRNTVVAAA